MHNLKRSYLVLFIFVFSTSLSYSQIQFEKGYYVDNAGNKTECLIKNIDWDSNPTRFVTQKIGGQPTEEITIEAAREFGIYGKSRYVRATIDVDRSSDKVGELSSTRAPEFNTEQVFLKALVEGQANLYMFVDGITRFYYKADSGAIQPLVYKQYRYNESILENQTFRQTLYNLFLCGTPDREDVDRALYNEPDLVKLFIKHNACLKSESADYTKKQSRDALNLWLRPRVTLSSFEASRNSVSDLNFQFENQVSFSAGIEAEFVLPFNKNKWAIIIEPTYQAYDASIPSEPIKIDYQALELPVGLRYYFYLNEQSKISLSAAFQLTVPFNSEVLHFSNVELKITNTSNIAFEVGYVFKNRFCVAYRIQTDKELMGSYASWASDYRTMAFVVGYSLF